MLIKAVRANLLALSQILKDKAFGLHHMSCNVSRRFFFVDILYQTEDVPLGWEDPLEEGMTTHSSILACRIPWTGEPGGAQSMGSQRDGLDSSNLICLHACPLFLIFLGVFIMNCCWILSSAFSVSNDIIMRFFFFSLLKWWITPIDLQVLKLPCLSGINSI